MKRKQLLEIINLASFIFEEKQYNTFMKYIYSKEYTSARLYLDAIIDKMDLILDRLEFLDDNDVLLLQYKKADILMDMVVELISVNDREPRKRKQVSTAT